MVFHCSVYIYADMYIFLYLYLPPFLDEQQHTVLTFLHFFAFSLNFHPGSYSTAGAELVLTPWSAVLLFHVDLF